MHEFVQEIEADLLTIEQHETPLDEANFVERVKALDVIEKRILDRIENVMYVHGYREDLAELYRRAAYLQQRLGKLNDQLFYHLQRQIVDATGVTLQRLCETYVGRAAYADRRMGNDDGYLDVFVNGILGIHQAPEETVRLESGMIGYIPTPTCAIFALLEHANLTENDVLYDLGAGLGRVPLLVGLLTAAQAIGIEMEPAYCAYAEQCAQALNLSRVTFINRDARAADYADGTIFFMYTPFTGQMLQAVLDKLHTEAQTRPIRIAAYGPCTSHVTQQSWLQLTVCQAFEHDTLALFTSHA